MSDQAEGLRQWASQQQRVRYTVPVVGLPEGRSMAVCHQVLERWQQQGHSWIGDPADWHFVAGERQELAEHPRWALWLEDDINGFRRAYQALKVVAARDNGPRQLLVLHESLPSQRGLLENVRQVAAQFFAIKLVIIPDKN
ncbi:hypothetical protein [Pseudidiomarina insulisalsae]|uniref:Uncharacterized protein n=1 Tax=Pseudidiomarina insulisalsae TaxID=575789 RepID=A0A432YE16_9GAMM|nr:hypothetical protein [Pseudidiomarina insulisalsae]RUO59072.1 hypothetical protein CWI71_09650 [Pseudidiomarina insulisalsae]